MGCTEKARHQGRGKDGRGQAGRQGGKRWRRWWTKGPEGGGMVAGWGFGKLSLRELAPGSGHVIGHARPW